MIEEHNQQEEDPWTKWNEILNKSLKETETQVIEFEYSTESPLWTFVYKRINYPNYEELNKVLNELKEKEAYVIIILYKAEWECDETGIVAFDSTGYPIF
jgi:DNA-directed RNA polymerase sigma subunit (sigma70/sigma32)